MPKEEKPLEYQHRVLDTKGLAQRLDLEYVNRTERWMLWRRRLSWILPAAALAVSIPLVLGIGGTKKAFDNGPVSRAHAIFESRCENCHSQAFSSVPDGACLKCHDGPAHPAKAIDTATLKDTPRCAQCHVEHRGVSRLAEVSDGNCTGCHADLDSHGQGVRMKSAAITGFSRKRHPEFSPASRSDERPLKLNHAKHMQLLVKDYPSMKLPMKCSDCHATDPNSAKGDLLPLTFDQNCRQCHSRELEFDVFQLLPGSMPAPHAKSVRTIDAFVEDTYKNALKETPSIIEKPLERDLEPTLNQDAWLKRVVQAAENYLFDPARARCLKCHEYQGDSDTLVKKVGQIRGQYAEGKPEGVPWLQRGEFSHRAHRAVDCSSCHTAARTSTRTADVLIPKIQNCTPCHGASGTAIDNCAQCHLFHNKSKETDKDRRPVEQLITRDSRFSVLERASARSAGPWAEALGGTLFRDPCRRLATWWDRGQICAIGEQSSPPPAGVPARQAGVPAPQQVIHGDRL